MTPLPDTIADASPVDAALTRLRTLVNRIFVAIFVAIVVIAIVLISLRYSEYVRDGRRNVETLANLLSEYVVLRLRVIDGALFRIAADSRRVGGPDGSPRDWTPVLRTATTGVPGISSIVILDADGVIRHATLQQILGLSWADRPIFQKLAQDFPNQLVVDPPMEMVVGDRVLVPFGRALNDPRGKFIGAAIATLIPNQLREFLGTFVLGDSGIAWVFLPGGDVLFKESAIASPESPDANPTPLFAETGPLNGDGFVFGPIVSGGADYLTAYREAGIADLRIAVSIRDTNVLRRWLYEAIGALLLIVLAGGFLFLAARRINAAALEIDAADPADASSDTFV